MYVWDDVNSKAKAGHYESTRISISDDMGRARTEGTMHKILETQREEQAVQVYTALARSLLETQRTLQQEAVRIIVEHPERKRTALSSLEEAMKILVRTHRETIEHMDQIYSQDGSAEMKGAAKQLSKDNGR